MMKSFLATSVHLPLTEWSRRWRLLRASVRGVPRRFLQKTSLPRVSWKRSVGSGQISMLEDAKHNGNVRTGELAVLCHLARDCEPGRVIFEIGTFDGRTTLNLAANSDERCEVKTLDLPPETSVEEKSRLDSGERHLTKASKKPRRFVGYPEAGRITELWGNSAEFDFSPYHGRCGLVFVDGSHHYDFAMSDSRKALRMVAPGGVIVWHDYGIWEGVTRALEELEGTEINGLQAIKGTSLVFWRKGM